MARILKFVADFAYLQSVLHFIKVIKSIDQKFEINLDFCKLEIMYVQFAQCNFI